MTEGRFLSKDELKEGLDHILESPTETGELHLIVKRPNTDERQTVMNGHLDVKEGLVGDNWSTRASGADPERQLTIMNARVAVLVADGTSRRKLAGDQLLLDMDLSPVNLPPGTQLAIGDAVIEVTEPSHTGCKKFAQRYGRDALIFVNSRVGKMFSLRGIHAKVVKSGDIEIGEVARKI